jgi:protein-disulfide isomerase
MKKTLLVLFCTLFLTACGATTPIDGGGTSSIPKFDTPEPVGAYEKGNSYAAVTVVEYANFGCPACGYHAKVLNDLVGEMGDQFRMVFGHFVFALHGMTEKEIMQLHNATECAGEQGKFWEYHDALFAAQGTETFNPTSIPTYAEGMEIDMAAFTTCNEEMRYEEKIENQKKRASAYNVSSTPTIFINGERFKVDGSSEVTPMDQYKAAIEAAQEKAATQS